MKTTIQSPATVGSSSQRAEKIILSKTQVEYIAIGLATIGVLMMTTAPEESLAKPIIGCAMILLSAFIAVRNNMKKGGKK